jgi:hypothetical protein
MQRMMSNYPAALQSLPDPTLAVEALPQQIVLIEAALIEDPDSVNLLRAASGLYLMYVRLQSLPEERARPLAARASLYARRALDSSHPEWGGIDTLPYRKFMQALEAMDTDDQDLWFDWASAHMEWIRLNPEHPDAQADVARVIDVMKHLVTVDPEFRNGMPRLYLATILAAMPPEAGGDLAESRAHFQVLFDAEHPDILPMARLLYATVYLEATDESGEQQALLEELAQGSDPMLMDGPESRMKVLARRMARRALQTSTPSLPESP